MDRKGGWIEGGAVLAETPAEPSHLWAPSGLFPTAEDRARQAEMRQAEPVGAARDRDGGDR
jgi:hypothetical protein